MCQGRITESIHNNAGSLEVPGLAYCRQAFQELLCVPNLGIIVCRNRVFGAGFYVMCMSLGALRRKKRAELR